jgi:PAB1-binding protein PBP1
LYGVQSTFDESLYTTKLDKNAKDYKEKMERAARKAAEIEKACIIMSIIIYSFFALIIAFFPPEFPLI